MPNECDTGRHFHAMSSSKNKRCEQQNEQPKTNKTKMLKKSQTSRHHHHRVPNPRPQPTSRPVLNVSSDEYTHLFTPQPPYPLNPHPKRVIPKEPSKKLMAVSPPRMAALPSHLALDNPVVVHNVHLVPVAVVVVVAAVVPVVAPLALVGDVAGALAAGGADAVREVDEAEDVLLFFYILVSGLWGGGRGRPGGYGLGI